MNERIPHYTGILISALAQLSVSLALLSELHAETTPRAHSLALTGVVVCLLGTVLVAVVAHRRKGGIKPTMADSLISDSTSLIEAAQQMTETATSLSSGAADQGVRLKETARALQEIAQTTVRTSTNSGSAAAKMQEVQSLSQTSATALSELDSAMKNIQKAATDTTAIIKTIRTIAFQTNLLALNAAVEAARAGDAGRGFAVVAEEVRMLSQRSDKAANDSSDILARSQKLADSGVFVSGTVTGKFGEISGKIRDAANSISAIAVDSKGQTLQIESLRSIVNQLDYVAEQNCASAQTVAVVGGAIRSRAEKLAHSLSSNLNVLLPSQAAQPPASAPEAGAARP